MIPSDPKVLDGEAYAQHRVRGFDLADLQRQAEHALGSQATAAGHHGPPPSLDDLHAAFAARRAGFEAARSSASSALAELTP